MNQPNFGSIMDKRLATSSALALSPRAPTSAPSRRSRDMTSPRRSKPSSRSSPSSHSKPWTMLTPTNSPLMAVSLTGVQTHLLPHREVRVSVKEFLVDDLGIDEQDSLRPMMDETPGKQVLVYQTHPSEDGSPSRECRVNREGGVMNCPRCGMPFSFAPGAVNICADTISCHAGEYYIWTRHRTASRTRKDAWIV